jgi:hypothetical protein
VTISTHARSLHRSSPSKLCSWSFCAGPGSDFWQQQKGFFLATVSFPPAKRIDDTLKAAGTASFQPKRRNNPSLDLLYFPLSPCSGLLDVLWFISSVPSAGLLLAFFFASSDSRQTRLAHLRWLVLRRARNRPFDTHTQPKNPIDHNSCSLRLILAEHCKLSQQSENHVLRYKDAAGSLDPLVALSISLLLSIYLRAFFLFPNFFLILYYPLSLTRLKEQERTRSLRFFFQISLIGKQFIISHIFLLIFLLFLSFQHPTIGDFDSPPFFDGRSIYHTLSRSLISEEALFASSLPISKWFLPALILLR